MYSLHQMGYDLMAVGALVMAEVVHSRVPGHTFDSSWPLLLCFPCPGMSFPRTSQIARSNSNVEKRVFPHNNKQFSRSHLDFPQCNTILTLFTQKQHQTPQVKGSVLRAHPTPHFKQQWQAQALACTSDRHQRFTQTPLRI